MTGLPKTREAVTLGWGLDTTGAFPHDLYDSALAEVASAEAVVAAARQLVAFAQNGDDDYIPKADLVAALARLDGEPTERDKAAGGHAGSTGSRPLSVGSCPCDGETGCVCQ